MPPEIAAITLVPAAFILLLASLVKSTTGFGFAMVSVPLLLLFWEPIFIVPIVMPLVFTVDALIVMNNRKRLEPRRVFPIVAAGVFGIPLGAYVLMTVPSQLLKVGIAGLVMTAASAMLFGLTIHLTRERIAGAAAGFISGVLAASTGLSGPPVTLFMINQRWAKDTFRNSLGLFFVFMDSFAILSLAITGALDFATLEVSAILWLPVLLGYLAATRVLPYVQQHLFLRISTGVVLVSAIMAMMNALR